MKIKVLIVPTLIIASGYVALNFIKPDFDLYQQKRTERNTAKANAEQAESIARNVAALKGELETQNEKVTFVKRYLPAEKDEARLYDSANFLTTQAGLVTSRIQIQKVEEETEEEGSNPTFAMNVDPVAAAAPTAGAGGAAGPGVVPMPGGVAGPGAMGGAIGMGGATPYQAPKVKKYSLTIDALGGYTNIKDLLRKLQGFDRMQQVQSFSISTSEGVSTSSAGTAGVEGETETSDTQAPGTLTLTYTANLPYQATPTPVTGEGIVSIPGLTQGNFNFSKIDPIQSAISDRVPDTVLGTEGKANPFE